MRKILELIISTFNPTDMQFLGLSMKKTFYSAIYCLFPQFSNLTLVCVTRMHQDISFEATLDRLKCLFVSLQLVGE